MDELFSEAAARLAEHPKLGRAGRIAGTRELIPHESYRLVYEIERETVWILALVHTARQWRDGAGSLRAPRLEGSLRSRNSVESSGTPRHIILNAWRLNGQFGEGAYE
jgi:hypothetical protein